MLTQVFNSLQNDYDATYGSIHNYYERLVFDALAQNELAQNYETDLLTDVACIALNHLPTKYVRYDVDTAFYQSAHEYDAIKTRVKEAVNAAIDYIQLRVKVREHGLSEGV